MAKPTKTRNNKQPAESLPEVFIASSLEGVERAYDIQAALKRVAEGTVWDQGVFVPSTYPLDQLVNAARRSDFGVFVFTPDDATNIKGRKLTAVRDNVIFELGLFVGTLGRERCFIVIPEDRERLPIRIPTDLLGLTLVFFKASRENTQAAIGLACNEIRKVIRDRGSITISASKPSDRDLLENILEKVTRPAPGFRGNLAIEALPEKVISTNKQVSNRKEMKPKNAKKRR